MVGSVKVTNEVRYGRGPSRQMEMERKDYSDCISWAYWLKSLAVVVCVMKGTKIANVAEKNELQEYKYGRGSNCIFSENRGIKGTFSLNSSLFSIYHNILNSLANKLVFPIFIQHLIRLQLGF